MAGLLLAAILGGAVWFVSTRRILTDGRAILITDAGETSMPLGGAWREVRLPRPGANALVLAGAVLLSIPLLLLLKSTEGRDLLQKCLLFSLLLHVILAMGFSAVSVSRDIVQYVQEEVGMEIPLNLEASRWAELQMQVRNQISELPPPPPAESSQLVPQVVPLEVAIEPPPEVRLEAPLQRASGMLIRTEAPDVLQIRPATPRADLSLELSIEPPLIHLPGIEPVAAPEASIEATPPPPPIQPMRRPLEAAAPAVSGPVVPLTPGASAMLLPVALPEPELPKPAAEAAVAVLPELSAPKVTALPPSPEPAAAVEAPNRPRRQATGEVGALPAVAPQALPPVTGRAQQSMVEAPGNLGIGPLPALAGLPLEIASAEVRLPRIGTKLAQESEAPPAAPLPLRPARAHPATKATIERPTELVKLIAPPPPVAPEPRKEAPATGARGMAKEPEPVPPVAEPVAPRTPGPIEQAVVPPLPPWVGPKDLPTKETLVQRAPEIRKELVQELGGSKETEAAVNRSLSYLAGNQQSDGRWTRYSTERSPRRKRADSHDVALTALTALSFLASDHTPNKPGPHQQTIRRALDFLEQSQTLEGDGRSGGSMYDQALSTIALAEAALMTGDERYRQAALRGAKFIVRCQSLHGGGWRYYPLQAGDMSVTGWQIMALHSASALGFEIPPANLAALRRFLDSVSDPQHRILASYLPGQPPTPTMTAQAVFSRLLLGQKLTDEQIRIASTFVTQTMPGEGEKDFYHFYCVSLMLMQVQNESWQKWNSAMRPYLLKLQRSSDQGLGSWDLDKKWSTEGGRAYTTALATLTLQVYYRYLPMYATGK